MQTENKKMKTEESTEGNSYRIRDNSMNKLNQYSRRDNSNNERLKEKKNKTMSSVSISQDGLMQMIQKQNFDSDRMRKSHNENVASLLKKINGDNFASTAGRQTVSTNNIIAKRAIKSREAQISRLHAPLDKLGLQNNQILDQKKMSLDKSGHPKQDADILPNLVQNSMFNGKKQQSNGTGRAPSDRQDILKSFSISQATKLTSLDDIQGQSLEYLDYTKFPISTEQLQQHLSLLAKSKGSINTQYNILQQKNGSHNDPSSAKRAISNRMQLEDTIEEDNILERDTNLAYFDQKANADDPLLESYQNKQNYIEESDKVDYFNNFTTNLTSKSQSNQKNLYTNNDSRFKLINQLRNKNYYQNNLISELQSEINEVDEFKVVLDKYKDHKASEEEVMTGINQEKRIMLLKAQLSKQQRHIRSLNSLLTSSRKSFKEVLDVCYFLLENVNQDQNHSVSTSSSQQQQAYFPKNGQPSSQKQTNQVTPLKQKNQAAGNSQNSNNKNSGGANQQVQQVRGSQNISGEDDPILPKTEDAMQIFFNQVSQNQAHQQLYSVLIGVEDRRKFVDNFNTAFSKVIQFQYKSEEFKKLFTVKKSKYTQQAEIKFNHPIRLLFDQFQNCFPVHTLFDFLEINQKQNVQNKLVTIMSLLRKTDRAFKKVRSYQLFKHNPVCFRESGSKGDITIPNFLLENQKLFSDFMQPRGYSRMLSLNFEKIMQTEQSLGLLMDKLVNYIGQLQQKGDYSIELCDLINSLRKGCEDLICLGIVIPNDQGSMGQRIAIVADNEIVKLQTDALSSTENITQQSTANQWFNYESNMDIFTEFNEKRGTLSIMFEEFSAAASVKDHKTCFELVTKIGTLLESFKAMFESKDNLIKLKNFEIAYLKNQQSLRVADQDAVQEFLEQMQSQIHQLLYPMNQKMNIIINSFTSLIDNGKVLEAAQRQNLIFTFKKNAKDILESIKRILANQFQNNSINILTLEQQFQQRVLLTQQRYNRLKIVIQKPVVI